MQTPRSYWLQEALAADTDIAPSLEGRVKAEVCIVGGGFTGLWTAIRLKEAEPALDIVLVERDVCGGGASGRNGGFVLSLWAKFLKLEHLCGTAEALRLAEASAEAVAEIGEFCQAHQIDAGYRRDGWLWAATSRMQVGAWTETVERIEQQGKSPFVAWTPEEVAHRSGSPVHLAGVFEPTAAQVQPAKLARGLRRVAVERGVRLFENTPLVRLVRSTPPVVHTPRGQVEAKKVVLAMNAWGIREPEIRQAVLVMASDMVITEPVTEFLEQSGWSDGLLISDARRLVHYYRTTVSGRIAFGKGGIPTFAFAGRVGPAFDGRSRMAGQVEAWLKWTYPPLRNVPCPVNWTGPIDRSKDGLPIFGRLSGRPDLLFGVGYSGNGVGPSVLGGRILASLVLEKKDEWSGCGLVRPLRRTFPPEPFRYLGSHIVRKAVALKDQAEDAGRKPNALVERIAALAPAGLSPTKSPKP
ncbi:MAG: FAD-dependent oxidoreductase [Nitrospinota bacterium]|nr:MAG: FAD-dependent oxidoreductase [Nitrospinota bacterium]